jgi:hypothetical protein
MSVNVKLNQVQCSLNAPKGQYNSFGKYNYRSNEDILGALKPILNDVGAVVVQSDTVKIIGDRVYVESTAQFIDCETGEMVENTAFAREPMNKKGMDEAQITGATSSYARKYALNGLFLIDDSKDADSMDNTKHHETPQEPEKPWLNDISKLVDVAKTSGWNGEEAVKQARQNYAVSKKTADEIKTAIGV